VQAVTCRLFDQGPRGHTSINMQYTLLTYIIKMYADKFNGVMAGNTARLNKCATFIGATSDASWLRCIQRASDPMNGDVFVVSMINVSVDLPGTHLPQLSLDVPVACCKCSPVQGV
jgi:hypothetical protein